MKPILNDSSNERVLTGVPNLDVILHGGLVAGSVTVIAGPPGSGKTILSHQIGFHVASPDSKVIFFQTLSEPTAKRLRFLKELSYFDSQKLEREVTFIDLGEPLRSEGVDAVLNSIMAHVKRVRPALVVIDSFKAFGDFVATSDKYRNFSYEVVVRLMAWDCTVLLLGEFGTEEIGVNPLFSVIDGILVTKQMAISGENRRVIQVFKMRGTDHSRDLHTFSISDDGIQIYTPAFNFKHSPDADKTNVKASRCKIGIPQMDLLLSGGVPQGSTVLVSGAAGTGKTVALLEFIYRGANQFGEKGIFISFEETTQRICAVGKGLGWDIEAEIKRGLIKIIFISQLDIRIEENLAMIREEVIRFGADRVAVDSISVFFDKVDSVQIVRDKVFQLTTIVQAAGAVGFFASNIPYGAESISRYGVEETVVDGVIILSAIRKGTVRQRFIEIYKLRNSAHVLGRHRMEIGEGGIDITPSLDEDQLQMARKKKATGVAVSGKTKPGNKKKIAAKHQKKTTTKSIARSR